MRYTQAEFEREWLSKPNLFRNGLNSHLRNEFGHSRFMPKKTQRKKRIAYAPVTGRPTQVQFVLPYLLPSGNRWERLHWTRRLAYKKQVAADIRELIGWWLWRPYEVVTIHTERRLLRLGQELDEDGAMYTYKALCDALQPKAINQYGLGIIIEDSPSACHMTLPTVARSQSGRAETQVTILPIGC